VDGRDVHVPELVFTHFGSGTHFRDAVNERRGAGMNGMGLKCVTAHIVLHETRSASGGGGEGGRGCVKAASSSERWR